VKPFQRLSPFAMRALLGVLLIAEALLVSGCDPSGAAKVVPVSGSVLLGADPLPSGIVTFTPDAGKGNTSNLVASGMIGENGAYSLQTENRAGALLGWYKVTIANLPVSSGLGRGGRSAPMQVPIARRYGDPDQSGISIEITETASPGAYDIRLAK
jgi:hypothetical protein